MSLSKLHLHGLPAILLTLSSILFSQTSLAAWTVDSSASSLYYVTSKAGAISELNSFGELSGGIDNNGRANVTISLGSVDTAIDIRNERMRDIVFQVADYPVASVSMQTDGDRLSALAVGESFRNSYPVTIELHGSEQSMETEVVVTKLQEGKLLVSLTRPLLINVAAFGLAEAVEQLREIAGLPSINNNIVVDFTLQFDESR